MKLILNVGTIFCFECVMALRRFIGSVEGVSSVEVEEGKVAIEFDPGTISEEKVSRLARESVGKLGYKVLE